jgi:hypothetical protein
MCTLNQIAKLMALVLLIAGVASFLMGQAAPSKKPPQPKVASEAASGAAKLKPDPEDFETIKDYSEALMNWKHEEQLGAGAQPGRFQIVLNPTYRRDIFLLDTQTGKIWVRTEITYFEGDPDIWIAQDRADNTQEFGEWAKRQTPRNKKEE